jgi:hypothetical protein
MNAELIEKNKDFVAEEVITHLEKKYPNNKFEYELLRRDIHMMIDVYMGEMQAENGVYLTDLKNPSNHSYYHFQRYKKSFTQVKKITDDVIECVEYTATLLKKIMMNEIINPKNDIFKQFIGDKSFSEESLDVIERIKGLILVNASVKREKNYHLEFIDNFFDKGFYVTKIPDHIQEKMWIEIKKTNWVYAKFSTTYKKVPDWYHENKKMYIDPSGIDRPDFERKIGDDLYTNAPNSLIEISQDLSSNKLFDPIKMYRPPNMISKYIHMWNGAENSPYHVDGIDGSDIICFCYLTEEKDWKKEWGGYINLLKEIDSEIIHNTTVLPNNGVMVIVNNSSPIFKHGVRNLVNRGVNRYTFVFHYTWSF